MAHPSHSSIMHYRLMPDEAAAQALCETLSAYAVMMAMLDELTRGKSGANLVALHDLAYEKIRIATGLPARLVSLGLRDFASARMRPASIDALPLDEKLFAIKGPSTLTIATVSGRHAVHYEVLGYSRGSLDLFNAQLVLRNDCYQIEIGVDTRAGQTEDTMTANESILSRMGRLIAGLANNAVDMAEGANKIVVVEQALREIDQAADDARLDIGKVKAEEYRILRRRGEIDQDLKSLDDKIRTAIASDRDDLAKAGVARQIDLESQLAALDKALSDAHDQLAEGQQALQAILAARREAEARLADLKRSNAQFPTGAGPSGAKAGSMKNVSRAVSAVSRVTGVPGGSDAGNSAELDELDRLHREQAIAARLAKFKTGQS